MGNKYTVLARNQEYMDVIQRGHVTEDFGKPLPSMYLPDPMEFGTVEELDAWARVAARIY